MRCDAEHSLPGLLLHVEEKTSWEEEGIPFPTSCNAGRQHDIPVANATADGSAKKQPLVWFQESGSIWAIWQRAQVFVTLAGHIPLSLPLQFE